MPQVHKKKYNILADFLFVKYKIDIQIQSFYSF